MCISRSRLEALRARLLFGDDCTIYVVVGSTIELDPEKDELLRRVLLEPAVQALCAIGAELEGVRPR